MQLDTVDREFALLKRFKCVDALNQGRLARTRRPANHNHFATINLSGAMFQDIEAAIPFRDIFNRNHLF